eukprot:12966_1
MSTFWAILSLVLLIHQTNSEVNSCPKSRDCSCPDTPADEWCTLKCFGQDYCKDKRLTCREDRSCKIKCKGKAACSGNTVIVGSEATKVNITCIGEDACKGSSTRFYCGTEACYIYCIGSKACADAVIDADSASSFTCEGNGCSGLSGYTAAKVGLSNMVDPEGAHHGHGFEEYGFEFSDLQMLCLNVFASVVAMSCVVGVCYCLYHDRQSNASHKQRRYAFSQVANDDTVDEEEEPMNALNK